MNIALDGLDSPRVTWITSAVFCAVFWTLIILGLRALFWRAA
jgi:hypothetical protein